MNISSCGSFSMHGLYGASDDLLTRCYLHSDVNGKLPTLVKMSRDVFTYYVRSVMNSQVVTPFFPAASTMSELARYFSREPDVAVGAPIKRLYDAEVIWSADVPEGTARFFVDGELTGETSGWFI